ncbi:MAG TPA: hypothetical protein ENN68_02120 [Methanomicrobia archaeon]|nr:hypothetical protein [Methanomicrobia archaeon]
MVEGGEARGGRAESKRKKAGDIKDTFSICLTSRTKQRLDKEVEEGLWDSRSQAISYYLHRGLAAEEYAREYANRQLLLLDEIRRSEEEGFDMVSVLLALMKKPEFRTRLRQGLEEHLNRE